MLRVGAARGGGSQTQQSKVPQRPFNGHFPGLDGGREDVRCPLLPPSGLEDTLQDTDVRTWWNDDVT